MNADILLTKAKSQLTSKYPYFGMLASRLKHEENENEIILSTDCKTQENKYQVKKKLTIDKKTNKPKKLEVQDINQNITVYILYNEIKINNLQKEDVLAFKLSPLESDI
mgnify:CR=1 FL=1